MTKEQEELNKEREEILQSLEKPVEKEENIVELRKKHEHNSTHEHCPSCGHYPLEEDMMGYERVQFCTSCTYSRSTTE